jgi:gliding motility-associated-like protein
MYLSDTTGATVIVRPETDMNYTVVTRNMYNCTDTATVAVAVRADAVIHLEDSVMLYLGEVYKISPSTNCTQFSWTPSGGLSGKYLSNPVAAPEVSTKYVVTGKTEWGCVTKDSINVVVNTEAVLTLPNAFAPGNGVNGRFKVIKRGLATLHHFRIYDRWGVVVYETKDIEEGWDGTYKGVPQPVGVYVYDVSAVTVNGEVYKKTGNVTLLR